MFTIHFTSQLILAIILSALVAWVIGAIWYSPQFGFGRDWMLLVGLDTEKTKDKKFKKKALLSYFLSYIILLFFSLAVAIIFEVFIIMSLLDVIKTALFLWAGFSLPFVAINTLYNPQLSWKLLLIDSGYHLICFLSIAMVLLFLI